MQLSVVLAHPTGSASASASLRALEEGLRGVSAEILVVHAGDPELMRAPLALAGSELRHVPGPSDSLVPHLWALGCRHAEGSAIALTTSHLRVDPGWGRALLECLEDAAAVGGPIGLVDDARLLDRAIHLLRYSAFAGHRSRGRVREIPGDNAAYRTEALRRNSDLLKDGFWDVHVNRRLREQDEVLAWAPEARARLDRSYRLVPFLRQRLHHGSHFGRYRTRELDTPVWRILVASPLVPAVMGARAVAQSRETEGGTRHALLAVPWLLLAASAWAAGEVRGALTARSTGSNGDHPR